MVNVIRKANHKDEGFDTAIDPNRQYLVADKDGGNAIAVVLNTTTENMVEANEIYKNT